MINKKLMNKVIFKGDCNYIEVHHNKTVNLDVDSATINVEENEPKSSAALMEEISFINGEE